MDYFIEDVPNIVGLYDMIVQKDDEIYLFYSENDYEIQKETDRN